MARATYLNGDLDIFLTSEDVVSIGLLETYDKDGRMKVRYKPLEVELQDKTKLTIQQKTFEDQGDGIKVERRNPGFYIQINNNAYWRMYERLGPETPLLRTLGGTRYQNADKINFWQEALAPRMGVEPT